MEEIVILMIIHGSMTYSLFFPLGFLWVCLVTCILAHVLMLVLISFLLCMLLLLVVLSSHDFGHVMHVPVLRQKLNPILVLDTHVVSFILMYVAASCSVELP